MMESEFGDRTWRWMARVGLAVVLLMGGGAFVVWWILSAPQTSAVLAIRTPGADGVVEVFVNGALVGETPYVLDLEDAWVLGDATISLPASWPPTGTTNAETTRVSSGYTLRIGMELGKQGVAYGGESVLYVNEDDGDGGVSRMLGLRISVKSADGLVVFEPSEVGAVFMTMAGHWRGEMKVDFVAGEESP